MVERVVGREPEREREAVRIEADHRDRREQSRHEQRDERIVEEIGRGRHLPVTMVLRQNDESDGHRLRAAWRRRTPYERRPTALLPQQVREPARPGAPPRSPCRTSRGSRRPPRRRPRPSSSTRRRHRRDATPPSEQESSRREELGASHHARDRLGVDRVHREEECRSNRRPRRDGNGGEHAQHEHAHGRVQHHVREVVAERREAVQRMVHGEGERRGRAPELVADAAVPRGSAEVPGDVAVVYERILQDRHDVVVEERAAEAVEVDGEGGGGDERRPSPGPRPRAWSAARPGAGRAALLRSARAALLGSRRAAWLGSCAARFGWRRAAR